MGYGHADIILTHFLEELIYTFSLCCLGSLFTFSNLFSCLCSLFTLSGLFALCRLSNTGSPGNLLTQVTANSDYIITKVKLILHHPGGAGTDNNGIYTIICNIFLNKGKAFSATETGKILHLHACLRSSGFQSIYIEDIANATPRTEICTIYFIH